MLNHDIHGSEAMSKWNTNRDKEFVDNLKADYAAMDTMTLQIIRSQLYDDLYTWGSELSYKVRATKELRLSVVDEVLSERGIQL
jgi:hypothetical protein